MKKTIILCTGNFILFVLFGLAFLYPAQQVRQLHPGISAGVGPIPILLLVYLIVFPVVYHLLAKKCHWGKNSGTELSALDEREQQVVAQATKAAYQVLIGGILVVVAALGGLRFFALFTDMQFDFYRWAVALLCALLAVATAVYAAVWCKAYLK